MFCFWVHHHFRPRLIALLLLLCVCIQGVTVISQPSTFESQNDRPIIGILSQEVGSYYHLERDGKFESYIAASYVKFIEGGGGRVVPIW